MTQQDARRRARSRKPPEVPDHRQTANRRFDGLGATQQKQSSTTTRADYYSLRREPAPVKAFSASTEFVWWLWCHLVWAWQQLEHWLANRRQGARVSTVEGVIDSVRVDDAALDFYAEMGWQVTQNARRACNYPDNASRETYYRTTPVVITLEDDRVIHFCEYQFTDRPMPSNAPYFAGLKGMRVRAAGWWDGDVFSAWGLHLHGPRKPQTIYVTHPPRDLPESLQTILSRRTMGFSEIIGVLRLAVGVLAALIAFALFSAELNLQGVGVFMAFMTGLFTLIPAAVLIIYALLRVKASPLRPIPEMVVAGELGNRHMRMRSYDFGRCERDMFHALERQKPE